MATDTQPKFDTAALQALDNAHYLHPFTDYRELHAEGARIQAHGDGIYIYDTDGKRIIDGLAGLCCVNIGYGRRELGQAAAKQMETLSFSHSFFKTSNVTAIQLAEQLVAMTPAPQASRDTSARSCTPGDGDGAVQNNPDALAYDR